VAIVYSTATTSHLLKHGLADLPPAFVHVRIRQLSSAPSPV
jgi:hypothetical protein